jgi:hypothetical protein
LEHALLTLDCAQELEGRHGSHYTFCFSLGNALEEERVVGLEVTRSFPEAQLAECHGPYYRFLVPVEHCRPLSRGLERAEKVAAALRACDYELRPASLQDIFLTVVEPADPASDVTAAPARAEERSPPPRLANPVFLGVASDNV